MLRLDSLARSVLSVVCARRRAPQPVERCVTRNLVRTTGVDVSGTPQSITSWVSYCLPFHSLLMPARFMAGSGEQFLRGFLRRVGLGRRGGARCIRLWRISRHYCGEFGEEIGGVGFGSGDEASLSYWDVPVPSVPHPLEADLAADWLLSFWSPR